MLQISAKLDGRTLESNCLNEGAAFVMETSQEDNTSRAVYDIVEVKPLLCYEQCLSSAHLCSALQSHDLRLEVDTFLRITAPKL